MNTTKKYLLIICNLLLVSLLIYSCGKDETPPVSVSDWGTFNWNASTIFASVTDSGYTGKNVSGGRVGVNLTWVPRQSLSSGTFTIYRSDSTGSNYVNITPTALPYTAKNYADKDSTLKANTTYKYKLLYNGEEKNVWTIRTPAYINIISPALYFNPVDSFDITWKPVEGVLAYQLSILDPTVDVSVDPFGSTVSADSVSVKAIWKKTVNAVTGQPTSTEKFRKSEMGNPSLWKSGTAYPLVVNMLGTNIAKLSTGITIFYVKK